MPAPPGPARAPDAAGDEPCPDCGGPASACTRLCCDECGTEECQWLWCAYGWRYRMGLAESVPDEACRALAAAMRAAARNRG